MRVLIITAPEPGSERCSPGLQGPAWGQRIAAHLQVSAPKTWQIARAPEWSALARTAALGPGSSILSLMLDEPEDLLPEYLPPADLLLVLTESILMTDLVADLAELCGAQAVIVPVDKRSWAPPGLVRQVQGRLEAKSISSAWPMPFCALAPNVGQHPLIHEFASRYGRPELICTTKDGEISTCKIVREAPCGNTRYIVDRLAGVQTTQAAEQCGLLHHYYPCWGGMETDPVHGTHTLLHIAATIAKKSVERALVNGSPECAECGQT